MNGKKSTLKKLVARYAGFVWQGSLRRAQRRTIRRCLKRGYKNFNDPRPMG